MKTLDIQAIMLHLPHRYPFLLIDRILDYEPHDFIRAIKNVSINENFFNGHFPQRPIMPGVLIVEAMAQAAAVLAFLSFGGNPMDDNIYLFAGIDKARFKRIVEPGDQLLIDIKLIKVKHGLIKVQATSTVEGELVCTAELMTVKKGSTS